MQWLEIWADSDGEKITTLCDKLETLGISGLVIEDEDDFKKFLEESREYWDYVDDDLVDSFSQKHRVKFYLEDSDFSQREIKRIQAALGFPLKYKIIRDEDWSSNWKAYYRPIEIGKKLLILPEWESKPDNSRIAVRLDPGLIFGTGSHPTTKICLEALEENLHSGDTILDLGCGSGILGIASIMLGAESVTGCDIDKMAPKIAMENAALNKIDGNTFTIYHGDILNDKNLSYKIDKSRYNIILANIVADVIINLAPKARGWLATGGLFICSGIIEGRQHEVRRNLELCGYRIVKDICKSGWYGYICA